MPPGRPDNNPVIRSAYLICGPLTFFCAYKGFHMSDAFTAEAKAMWDAIPAEMQTRLLTNVWCAHCSRSTTITKFNGRAEKDDLILSGHCATCGGKVARLIEGS